MIYACPRCGGHWPSKRQFTMATNDPVHGLYYCTLCGDNTLRPTVLIAAPAAVVEPIVGPAHVAGAEERKALLRGRNFSRESVEAVLALPSPYSMELVYPPATWVPEPIAVEPPVVPVHSTTLSARLAPFWLGAYKEPEVVSLPKAKPDKSKRVILRFPKGAIATDGIHYISATGRKCGLVKPITLGELRKRRALRRAEKKRAVQRLAAQKKIKRDQLVSLLEKLGEQLRREEALQLRKGLDEARNAHPTEEVLLSIREDTVKLAEERALKASLNFAAEEDFSFLRMIENTVVDTVWEETTAHPEGNFYVVDSVSTQGEPFMSCLGRETTVDSFESPDIGAVEFLDRLAYFEALNSQSKIHQRFAQALRGLIGIYPVDELRGMCEDAFLAHEDDLRVQVAILETEISEIGPSTLISKGLFAWSASAAKYVSNLVLSGKNYAIKVVTDFLESTFKKVMDPYLSHMEYAAGLISTFWSKCTGWIQHIQEKAGTALKLLGQASLWSLGVMIASAIVVLAETILVQLGVWNQVGVVLGIFLTLVLSYLGFTAVAVGAEKLFELQCIFKSAVLNMIVSDSRDEVEVSSLVHDTLPARSFLGFDAVVGAITKIGNALISSKLHTLQYYGKLASALDQLRKGKDVLKELVAWLLEIIGKISDHISGRQGTFFDELSAMVQVDVKSWIEKSQQVMLQAQTLALSDKMLFQTVEKLLCDGNALLTSVSGVPRKTSMDYATQISKLVDNLKELHKRVVRAGVFEGRRNEPFWLYIFGPSHCGKSLLMEDVTAAMLDSIGAPLNSIYSRSCRDPFWSNYMREACVWIDDLSATQVVPSQESEMINIISSKMYSLNMAHLEDKGMLFDSKMVVTSSNVFTAPTSAGILEMPAYNNRRNLVLEAGFQEGEEFDPNDKLKATKVRFVDNNGGKATSDWMTPRAAFGIICESLRQHIQKENIMTAQACGAYKGNQPSYVIGKAFLEGVSHEICQYIPESDLQALGIEDTTAFFFAAVDDKLYKFDACRKAVEMKVKVPSHLEERCLTTLLPDIQVQLARGPRNGLVGTFLESLVAGTSCVASVNKLSSDASELQVEFFQSLGLAERVYLRMVQKKVLMLKADPAGVFVPKLYERICGLVGDSRNLLTEHGNFLLMMIASVLCLGLSCYGFLYWLSVFSSGPSVASATIAMTALTAKAQASSGRRDEFFTKNNQGLDYRYVQSKANGPKDAEEILCLQVVLKTVGINPTISCLQHKGRSIMLTRHQALTIPASSLVQVVMHKGNTVNIFWDPSNLTEWADSELVLYSDSKLPDLPCSKWKHFLDDNESQLPNHFNVTSYVRRTEEGTDRDVLFTWNAPASVISKCLTIAYSGTKLVRMIPQHISLEHNTIDHECGAFAVAYINKEYRIVGLLVAGDARRAAYAVLPRVDMLMSKALVFNEEDGVVTEGFEKCGFLERQYLPHLPTKTHFVKVPEELCVNVEESKEPSVIAKGDPRLIGTPYEDYDPLRDSMVKFATPMEVLEPGLLDDVAEDIVSDWLFHQPRCHDVSLQVAINGYNGQGDEHFDSEHYLDPLIESTSEGYPFVLERKNGEYGKARYFEGAPREKNLKPGTSVAEAYDHLEKYAKVAVPELICIECPKDERLPRRKIVKPKTRLFSILPVHFNLRLRVKFLAFSQFLMLNRKTLPTQVGINPYSREWLELYARLGAVAPTAYNCDYSCFDGLMTGQVLEVIGKMINSAYVDDDGSKKERLNLLMAIWGRKTIAGSQVYTVRAGIPSGCALTVLLNSIFNEILVRYAYKRIVGGPERERFNSCVCLIVYGDDNLIAVASGIEHVFTGNNLQKCLAGLGVGITDGTDKTAIGLHAKPLCEIDFLKRKFKLSTGGQVFAPLDYNSILSSLVWISSSNTDVLEALLINVVVSQREMFLHGRQEFDNLTNFYLERIPMWKNKLLTWKQCDAFHQEQIHGMVPDSPALVLDILITPQFQKFMMCQAGAADRFNITNQICVAGPKYRIRENEFIVSFSGTYSDEINRSVSYKTVYGYGVGRLPTLSFVNKFRSNRCHNERRLLIQALSQRKILVFRGNAPYVDVWACALAFAESANLLKSTDGLHLYRNLVGKGACDLSMYFEKQCIGDAGVFSCFGSEEDAVVFGEDTVVGCLPSHVVAGDNAVAMRKGLREISSMNQRKPFSIVNKHERGTIVGIQCVNERCPGHIVSSNIQGDVERLVAQVRKQMC